VTNAHGAAVSNLTDTVITAVVDGHVLTYDAASGKWKNKVPPAGGGGGTGTVTSVGAAAPITVSGTPTVNPTIGISPAAAGAAGSMSGADKTKLDAITGTHTGNNSGDITVANTATINMTLVGQLLSAIVAAGSIGNTQLDAATVASLGRWIAATIAGDIKTGVTGNVGIGIDPYPYATGNKVIDLGDRAALVYNSTIQSLYLVFGAYVDAGGWKSKLGGTSSMIALNTTSIYFYTAASAAANAAVTWVLRSSIDIAAGVFKGLWNNAGAGNASAQFQVVTALPGTPDANTIYFVTT
jgi:hypothetical protein